jgi:enolase
MAKYGRKHFTENKFSNIWHDIMKESADRFGWAHFHAHEEFTNSIFKRMNLVAEDLSYREKALIAQAISIALAQGVK